MDSLSSFLNVKGVSEYLALKKSTVYSLVEEKKIPHYRIRRQIRFKKSEIDEWMEERKEPAVDARVEVKKVFRSIERKGDFDVNAVVKKSIEDVVGRRYTFRHGKPDRTRGLRKEVEDGYLP